MKKPLLVVTIGNQLIDSNLVYDFQYNVDIETHLPTGKLILNDKKAHYLAKFQMPIGTIVKIVIYETGIVNGKVDNSFALSPLVITRITHGSELDDTIIGGYMQIDLAHPWVFYNNYTPHAYAPQKISTLVKSVLKDNSRGYTLKIDDSLIDVTDDKGNYPRYKCGESDYDFILDKLLPYATINNDPVYFFIDDFGNIHFTSLKKLINKSCSAILYGQNFSEGTDGIDKLKTSLGTDKSFVYANITLVVGGGEQTNYIQHLQPKLYFEDLGTHKFISGIKGPTTKIAKKSGNNSGNKIPVDKVMMYSMGATDSIQLINRAFDDQFGLAINSMKDLDKIFRITLILPFCMADIRVGSIIYLYTPSIKYTDNTDEKNKIYWLAGKWIVKQSLCYLSNKSDAYSLRNEITLIRPNFIINKQNTSLKDDGQFWEI